MLGRTRFLSSEFGIFGGFGWARSSVLLDKPGFRKVRSSFFPDLDLDSAHFWPNRSLKFGLFGMEGFEWVQILVLVDEPGFK